jgi:hypothetical protein
MRFDFSSVDDVESFVSVPEGVHNCRVAEVREGRARDGSVRWSFRLEVLDGDYAGRTAAWDSVTWSERGVYRVKKIFASFGLDVRGELELDPDDLVNLQARVKVEPEEREDPVTGRRQVRMRVPYLGYAPIEQEPKDANGRAPALQGEDESLAPVDAWGERRESQPHAPSADTAGTSEQDSDFTF